MMRLYIILTTLVLFSLNLSAQETDSIKYNTLQEVVVESDRAWIEGNKAVFIPTKKEKNLSKDPTSLVESMHIPTVIVTGGEVKSYNGKSVTFFINGVKADEIDMTAFLTKDVKRVEYIENPSDPTYETVPVAINIVVTQYELGGITKSDLNQAIPNKGIYKAASKLVYKSMTYGMLLNGGYSRNHDSSSRGEDTYSDITYNGTKYDEISREYDSHTVGRNDFMSASLNARWKGKIGRMTHTAGLMWNRNPGSESSSSDLWIPNLFDSHSSYTSNSNRKLSPQISGNYFFKFNPKWSLTVNWKYAYAHTNTYAGSDITGMSPIDNYYKEDAHSIFGEVSPSLSVSDKLTMALNFATTTDRFKTNYSGSANENINQWRTENTASFFLSWQAHPNTQVTFKPGLLMSSWKSGTIKSTTEINPTVKAYLSWNPMRKLMVSATLNYFNHAPQTSQISDIIVRESELMWVAGNSLLKRNESWDANVDAMWFSTKWLRTILSLRYTRRNNEFISTYVTKENYDGIVKNYTNAASQDSYHANLFLNGYFFNRVLNVNLQPEWSLYKTRGVYADKLSTFRIRGGADLTLGNNFSAGVSYWGAEKYLTNGGMMRNWNADQWNIDVKYGNGNIFCSVALRNVFNTYHKSWSKFTSSHYSSYYDSRATGRQLLLNFSYTFSYGKKVSRDINVSLPTEMSSGIVGSDK